MDLSRFEHRALIRLSGELATKSRHTRRRFQRRLLENLEDAFRSAGVTFEIESDWGRMFAGLSSRVGLDVIGRVFGIASFSEIEAIAEARLQDIVEAGERAFAELVRGRTFGVRARRVGRHPFTSHDINCELGAALDRYASVDLRAPDIWVGVEVRGGSAFLFSRKELGAGGLPAGVEGGALALVSGGFDSAVASWMMLKRGVALDFVFCNLAGAAYERAVLGVAKLLANDWCYGLRPRIHVVDFEAVVSQLKDRVLERYWQIVLKRQMYRAADWIARETGAHALVTGESVGQVSSQTLANLAAIAPSAQTPVLRPLVGFDKREIIDRSREIGTYALSEKVREHCALTDERPVTDATPAEAAAAEAGLDAGVLETALAGRRTLDLRALDVSDLVLPYLYTAEVPDEAVLIDTRPLSQYEPWHYPGAIHRDFWELLQDHESLDRDRTYVLYCEIGLRTAQLAEKLQQAGYEAYSFKGGARALREYAAAHGVPSA